MANKDSKGNRGAQGMGNLQEIAQVGALHDKLTTEIEDHEKAIAEHKAHIVAKTPKLKELRAKVMEHFGIKQQGANATMSESYQVKKDGSPSHAVNLASFLNSRPNPVTANVIWENVGKDTSVKQTLAKMVKGDFVSKVEQSGGTVFALTDKGVKALAAASERMTAIRAGSAPAANAQSASATA